jgi:GLPGLI family protein
MKKILFPLLFAFAQFCFAQNKEGVIHFEMKINMHRRIPKYREDMKAMIPEYRTEKLQLFFNATESLYQPVDEENEEDEETNGGGMRMRMMRPQTVIYIKGSQKIEQRDFFGKKYLVEDTLKPRGWKLTEETKTIQGYVCKKATFTTTANINMSGPGGGNNRQVNQNITAWYAEKLPFAAGPGLNQGLPGMVLEVDVNDGEMVITTKSVELRTLKKGELKAPTEGKKVTEAEFRKLMMEQMPQGGRMMRD